MTTIIRDIDGIRNAIRARRDELNLSHETIDNLAGLQSGYCSKLLAPEPMKNFGAMSLPAILGALAIGLVVVEDLDQRKRVEGRWQKRKRPQRLPRSASALSSQIEIQVSPEMKPLFGTREWMKMIGALSCHKAGKASAKRRMKTMGKRARQRAATHAARKRWSKSK